MFRHRMVWLAVIIIALGGVGIWYLSAGSQAPAAVRLVPNDAKIVALGETIYRDQCAVCHGANLEGQAQHDGLNPL